MEVEMAHVSVLEVYDLQEKTIPHVVRHTEN